MRFIVLLLLVFGVSGCKRKQNPPDVICGGKPWHFEFVTRWDHSPQKQGGQVFRRYPVVVCD